MSKKNRIIIPCRIAYLNCWKPSSEFGSEKYSLVAIIKKTDTKTIETIQETIDYVKSKSIDKWGGRIPPNCKSPLHDGDIDKPDNPIFKNSTTNKTEEKTSNNFAFPLDALFIKYLTKYAKRTEKAVAKTVKIVSKTINAR